MDQRDGTSEDTFVQMRKPATRPFRCHASSCRRFRVNILAGHLPEPDESGKTFLKVPVSRKTSDKLE